MSKEGSKYMSFKITLPKTFLNDVLKKSFWPMGIGFKIWKDFNHRTQSRSRSFVGRKFQMFK